MLQYETVVGARSLLGTQFNYGYNSLACFEVRSQENPDEILEDHRDYFRALIDRLVDTLFATMDQKVLDHWPHKEFEDAGAEHLKQLD